MNPLVSVIIPVYNGEKYVEEAIVSVLNQDYDNIEVLVIDDGSTDGSLDVVGKYADRQNVKVLFHERHQNRGVSRTRRLGVENASGKYIAFLDADDVFSCDKIRLQVSVLERELDVVLCHGAISLMSEATDPPPQEQHFGLKEVAYKYSLLDETYFLKSNRICNSTVLLRRSCLDGLDFASSQLFQYEDFLLWLLLSEKGDFYYLPNKLIFYRYHRDSATAKIVENELVPLYSKLEFCLTSLSRVTAEKLRAKIAVEIRECLVNLLSCYANNERNSDDVELKVLVRNVFMKEAVEGIAELEAELDRALAELKSVKKSYMKNMVRKFFSRFF